MHHQNVWLPSALDLLCKIHLDFSQLCYNLGITFHCWGRGSHSNSDHSLTLIWVNTPETWIKGGWFVAWILPLPVSYRVVKYFSCYFDLVMLPSLLFALHLASNMVSAIKQLDETKCLDVGIFSNLGDPWEYQWSLTHLWIVSGIIIASL